MNNERDVFDNIPQRELIAWLDAQERKPLLRAPRNEDLAGFDPLDRERMGNFLMPNRIVELYDRGEHGEQGRPGRRQRTINWRFTQGLTRPLVPQMMNKIKQSVRTRHKVKLTWAYKLLNL